MAYEPTYKDITSATGSFLIMAQYYAPKANKSWIRLRGPDDMESRPASEFAVLLMRGWGASDMGDISLTEYLEGHGFTVLKEVGNGRTD